MAKKETRETADTNIRIWKTTHATIQELSRASGKSIPRVLDEKFNPTKYDQSTPAQ